MAATKKAAFMLPLEPVELLDYYAARVLAQLAPISSVPDEVAVQRAFALAQRALKERRRICADIPKA